MAELEIDGSDLVLRLRFGEKAASVHGDPRAPLSAVRRVRVLEDPTSPPITAGRSASICQAWPK
jgi:hypothetical protein